MAPLNLKLSSKLNYLKTDQLLQLYLRVYFNTTFLNARGGKDEGFT